MTRIKINTLSKSDILDATILFSLLVYLFHITRNISQFYFLIYILAALILIFVRLNKKKLFYIFLSVILFIYIGTVSASYATYGDIWIGLMRMFFIFPCAIFMFSHKLSNNYIRIILLTLLLFIIGSSLSIVYQVYFGEITWFSETSWRAGVEKFSSLAGNENTYGAISGVGIVISLFILKKFTTKCIAIFIILLGAVLSLQKMSIISVFLGFIIYIISYRLQFIKYLFYLILAVGIFYISIALLQLNTMIDLSPYLNYFTSILSDNAENVGDATLVESAFDRITYLPQKTIDFWGINLLFGVGVYGGAGVLGYPDLPMAHNLIIEIIAIFGTMLGVAIISFLAFYIYKSFKIIFEKDFYKITDILIFKALAAIYLIILLGGIFTGGLFFQPVVGLIFFLSISQLKNWCAEYNEKS